MANSLFVWLGTPTFPNGIVVSAGQALFPNGTAALPSIAPSTDPTSGIFWLGNQTRISVGGTLAYQFTGSGLQFSDTASFLILGSNGDLILGRDAAQTLAQRNGTNAQLLKVYNTFTSAVNFERFGLNWESNSWSLGPESTGGTVRGGFYKYGPSSVLAIAANVITPTNSVHHVGAGLIKTITVPANVGSPTRITIIPDAAFTTDATGNISLASTAVINRAMDFTWDGTKWNPSY